MSPATAVKRCSLAPLSATTAATADNSFFVERHYVADPATAVKRCSLAPLSATTAATAVTRYSLAPISVMSPASSVVYQHHWALTYVSHVTLLSIVGLHIQLQYQLHVHLVPTLHGNVDTETQFLPRKNYCDYHTSECVVCNDEKTS